jgi:hypothetical protein
MEIIAVILLLGAAAWLFYKKRPNQTTSDAGPTVRLQGAGTYDFAIVGASRYRSALKRIYGDDDPGHSTKEVDATLILEDANKQGTKSVRVDIQGRAVGYLPRELAHEYRQRLVEGGYPRVQGICKAKITLHMAHGMGDADFTVRLDLPPKKKLV